MPTWLARIFNSGEKEPKDNFGFSACAQCTTGHTPHCDKIDAELAARLGLEPRDPQYNAKLSAAKAMVFDNN